MTPRLLATWLASSLAAALRAGAALAQVSASNLVESQAGNVPFARYFGSNPSRLSTYDQLNADLVFSGLRLGFRYESLDDSDALSQYSRFTQRYADWKQDGVRVRVGDFQTLLGRGLVFRAFELPGVVLADPTGTTRGSFSRELDGVLVEGDAGPVRARAFSGRDDGGTRAGAEAALEVWRGARLGATWLRATNPSGCNARELGSGYAELDPFGLAGLPAAALPVYVEYAQADRSAGEWFEFRTGDRVPHALYVASEFVAGNLAMSAEWKDYRDFRLGWNDPPSLVREHAWALPNRSTHVLDATSEHGVQFEGSWTVPGWGALTANHSRAAGTPAGRVLRFEESFFEVHLAPRSLDRLEWSAFYDRGSDDFRSIRRRDIRGAGATYRAFADWSASLDAQRLDAERVNVFAPNDGFTDTYLSLQVARAKWGSLAWIVQRTTDPIEEDPERFGGAIDPRTYRAWNASVRLGQGHTLGLFAGERRGGPACTAGTCYEVTPFKGAELRLQSRF